MPLLHPRPGPVPDPTALPSRKHIRAWLAPMVAPRTVHALGLVVVDLALFVATLALVVAIRNPWVKVLAGLVAGYVVGRLFLLGHDACHQSLTPHRRLNRWLGRLVFLPSLTPYSPWEIGHNVIHHGFTNLRHVDFVWQPLSLEEFKALPRTRRTLERLYRSGWAPWLYYLVEAWWKRLWFPRQALLPSRRASVVADGALVTAFALVWMGVLAAAAVATGQSVPLLLATGFALPYVTWAALAGFTVYVNHTHESVAWYGDRDSWSSAQAFLTTSVHIEFGSWVGRSMHNIMEHTAHHTDMTLPLYCLPRAQQRLEQELPGHVVFQRFSWAWYRDTARRCKLYDYERRCWTDFDGRATTRSMIPG